MEMLLALALASAPQFSNLNPSGVPAARRSCSAALIPGILNDAQISYGGFNAGTQSDLIQFDTATNAWATVTSTIPARERHSMGYDPVHDVVVIVSGVNGTTVQDTVFLLDPSTYAEATPALPANRPSARADALLEWVPPLGKFVYFGGRTSVFANAHVSDTWTLDVGDGGVTWAQLMFATAQPTQRGATCHAWDPEHGQILMFGGEGASDLGDTWAFTADGGWNALTVSGTVPAARSFPACAWEPNSKQLVLYGGQISGTASGGLYTFDPATKVWSSFSPSTNPGVLSDAAAAFSPALGGVIFFAGRIAATSYTNLTWLLKLDQPPVADAGPDFSVAGGAVAQLSGSGTDPDGDAIASFAWLQTGGSQNVTLSSSTAAGPTFTAPIVPVDSPLTFSLVVNDGTLPSTADSVTVLVLATDAGTPDAGIPDAGTPDAGTPDAGTPDAGPLDAGLDGGIDPGTDAGTFFADAGVDAGVETGGDAGEPDGGGGPDAGVDAGATNDGGDDAGAEDTPDGGVTKPRLSTGCACSHSPVSVVPLLLALCLWRRRVRRGT